MPKRAADGRSVRMTPQRLGRAIGCRRRRQLSRLFGWAAQDAAAIGTRALSVGDTRDDGAGIIAIVWFDFGGHAVVVDKLLRW